MRDRFKRLPSPSMGVAFIALLAALTGTAVALPGSNTVTSGDIKKNAVRSSDIKASNVGSSDVKNNALTGSDVDESKLGEVPSATNADNAANAANATNATTATNATQLGGTAAAAHLRNYERVFQPVTLLIISSPDTGVSRTVNCPAGKKVVGGGANIVHEGAADQTDINNVVLKDSYASDADSWFTQAVETDPVATNWNTRAYALCATG